MEEETEETKKETKDFLSAVFFIGWLTILRLIFENFFPFSIASSLSLLICGLSSYFLSVRGTVNSWSKDKNKWTFSTYSFWLTLACGLMFILGKIFVD